MRLLSSTLNLRSKEKSLRSQLAAVGIRLREIMEDGILNKHLNGCLRV